MSTSCNCTNDSTVIRLALLLGMWAFSLGVNLDLEAAEKGDGLRFYESRVFPILREHCLKCHSHDAGKARGGLVLDSRGSMLTGGDSGPAVTPGDADNSLLIRAIRYGSDEIQMPPSGKIKDDQINILIEWVQRGAPSPASAAKHDRSPIGPPPDQHWAFEPLSEVDVPTQLRSKPQAIDFLIERARAAAGVSRVAAAERSTLVRRLYLDLVGLPPELGDLETFVKGDPPITIESMVDELLSRPEFGERWGRHWLDVARYADSNGCSIESNNTYDNAWRYRDYVIAAFNNDKPYNRFVVEQIAGDLLDHASTTQRCEQLVATGFLLLGPKAFGTSGIEQVMLDVIDEQIDTVGKAMLGLSLGCARCHDHKFDPVSTADYYSLAGIFSSTLSVRKAKGWRQGKSWNRVQLPVLDDSEETSLKEAYQRTKEEAESGKLEEQAQSALTHAREAMSKLQRQESVDARAIAAAEELIEAAEREMHNAQNMAKVLPVISPVPVAMAVIDRDTPRDEAIRVRGERENRGAVVSRRVPPVLLPSHPEHFRVPTNQSGRLQLANWLVDEERGAGYLLARVAVNRVWGHLFARPFVASPDNFGVTGDAPTHPELLDYLAARFIEMDWSLKRLIREIVLTETYQLAAVEQAENLRRDPSNTWLWRYEPKRIDVEVLRDSMLAMSGQLDRARGGKTLQHLGLVSLGGDHLVLDSPSPYRRRSVYIPIYRDAIGLTKDVDASMGMLNAFDFADPNLMAGARSRTVVPSQALFLMNADFVYEQAKGLAEKMERAHADEIRRLDQLFRVVFGRSPSEEEQQQALEYVRSFPTDDSERSRNDPRSVAWTSLCQALLGSNEFLFQD